MRTVEPLALARAGAAMLTHGTTSSGRLRLTLQSPGWRSPRQVTPSSAVNPRLFWPKAWLLDETSRLVGRTRCQPGSLGPVSDEPAIAPAHCFPRGTTRRHEVLELRQLVS